MIAAAEKKVQIQNNCITFARNFMGLMNLKDVLKSVRYDVPRLLGFQNACIYILDQRTRDNLFAVSLDEDADKRVRELGNYSFEQDFVFEDNQIVRFPTSLGVNGFTCQNNAINYFNDGSKLLTARKCYSSVYQIGGIKVPQEF